MRKAICVLLVLFALAVGGMTTAHIWVNGLGDNVTITETILAGDKSAAAGVRVSTNTHYEETPLYWETAYTVGSKDMVETTLDYDLVREDLYVYEDAPMLLTGYNDEDSWIDPGREQKPEDYGYPMELFEELIAATPAGGEKYGRIKLSDAINYRSSYIVGSFFVGDKNVNLNGREDGDYFRFPMTTYSDYSVHVEKRNDDTVRNLSIEPQQAYNLDEAVALSPDLNQLYVAVGDMFLINWDENGTQEEVRSVPLENGTCGVHRFKTTVTDRGLNLFSVYADLQHGELVYPLDQGTSIEKLWVSADESQLFLITHEEDDIWFTALDIGTFDVAQRMRLFTYDSNVCDAVVVKDDTDYIAAFFDDGHVALMTKNKEAWQLEVVDRLYRGETVYYSFSIDGDERFAVDFDGKRFAIANSYRPFAGAYFLWVYEGGTCSYAGFYESSLGSAGLQEADKTDNPTLRYTCDTPITLSMPSGS